jgi:hypothetical protein
MAPFSTVSMKFGSYSALFRHPSRPPELGVAEVSRVEEAQKVEGRHEHRRADLTGNVVAPIAFR